MGIFDRFINQTGSAGGVPIVSSANPVDWGRLGQTAVFAVIATASLMYQTIVGAVVDGLTMIYDGIGEFIGGVEAPEFITNPTLRDAAASPGLLETIFGELAGLISGAYGAALNGVPDLLQLPVAVAATLAAFYVASIGLAFLRDEVI